MFGRVKVARNLSGYARYINKYYYIVKFIQLWRSVLYYCIHHILIGKTTVLSDARRDTRRRKRIFTKFVTQFDGGSDRQTDWQSVWKMFLASKMIRKFTNLFLHTLVLYTIPFLVARRSTKETTCHLWNSDSSYGRRCYTEMWRHSMLNMSDLTLR